MQNDRLNSGLKFNRVLVIYSKLMNGEIVNKYEEAEYFGVDPRSIQRDINDLRCFFADNADLDESCNELVYDRQLNGYHLVGSDMTALTNSEALAVCKILLGSRAFTKNEMTPIINKLLTCCVKPKNKQLPPAADPRSTAPGTDTIPCPSRGSRSRERARTQPTALRRWGAARP